MKVRRQSGRKGFALMLVIVFAAVSLVLLGGVLRWTSVSANLTERNNQYYSALYAAEAATEKVVANISNDFRNGGEAQVYNNIPSYAAMVPTAAESDFWSGFGFNDAQGHSGKIYLERLGPWSYTELESKYSGLHGMASTYRLVSDASRSTIQGPVTAGVLQDVQVAAIPLFQFAIFYSVDLEMNPGAQMTVIGRVHSNGSIYTQPSGVNLNFAGDVTACGSIYPTKKPGDPSNRSPGSVSFQGAHDAGVTSLNMPIGTNNSPAAVHGVLEIPPSGEDPNSAMGKQRFYNRSDLVLLVAESGVRLTSGAFNGFSITVPWSQATAFVSTNAAFYNKREGRTVRATQIDVGQFALWNQSTNNSLRPALGRDAESIYVADLRSLAAGDEPGLRLVDGQQLPLLGLTVATPDPIYIQGNYNAPSSALGTTNTSGAAPAAILGDAITILSPNWNDANSGKSISARVAANTTVNAAFMAGIVPTQNGYYSGGVENFPRFLENWSGRTFTYNGSMVVMCYSEIADMPWGGSDVYSPPKRNWTFDLNFLDSTKLPPQTPQLLTLIRARWAILAAGATN